MEAMMLDDIMRLVTMMINNPDPNLPKTIENSRRNPSNIDHRNIISLRQVWEENTSDEEKIIHPTQLFDMIAGTSTGSLIAFALVGGEILNKTCDMDIMSVTNIINMYRKATKNIFENQGRGTVSEVSWWRNPITWLKEQYKTRI